MKQKRNKVVIFIFILLISISVNAESCDQILGPELKRTIQDIFDIIKVLAPALLLVFTTVDFAKAVFTNNEKDGMEKAKNNFVKRAVAALIVFLSPQIIKLLLGFIGGDITSCLGSWR